MARQCVQHSDENTHDRLRQTALELFSAQGYQSTSMRDLATHLGIQAGSIYNYIKNKQCLLFELMEEVLDDLLAESRHQIKRKSTLQARLRQFVCTWVSFHATERKSLALLEREAINLSAMQRQRIETLRQEYAQCLSAMIVQEAAFRGLPITRLTVLVQSIIGMLQSLLVWYEGDSMLPRDQLVDNLTSMIFAAIESTLKQQGQQSNA